MPLKIEITASNQRELEELLRAFYPLMGPGTTPAHTHTIVSQSGQPVAKLTVPPGVADPELNEVSEADDSEADAEDTPAPARGRGRPRKNPAPEAVAESAPEVAATPTDKAPADIRAEAIRILTTVFARSGSSNAGPKAVKALQAKFGVTKFAEVPDERVGELLTDAIKADKETGG